MLDLSHIPNSQQDVQVFYSNGITSAWQTWNKPRKCNYVYIICIGGGGGGAGGAVFFNSQQNTGGASGAVSRALYNAQQLPDRLYVQVGLGGAGGNANSNGSAGTRSFVALQPITSAAQNIVAISGAAGAAGGIVNAVANSSGETASTQVNATFYTLSNFLSTIGQTSLFSANSNQTALALTSQVTTSGGNGDPGQTFVGGTSILSSSISPLIQGGTNATTSGSNGGNGADGITSWKPFYSLGGAGGGAAVSGSGGNGGNGGIGSGGGGAGTGNSLVGSYTGGRGGKGGDGLVVIVAF